MKHKKNVFVLVDAYCGGSTIAALLRGYGYDCIHVQSQEYVNSDDAATFVESDYIRNILYSGDLEKLKKTLSQYEIKAVLPGDEMGVLFADQLNEALQLPQRNDLSLSLARRNKYLMHEALKKANVDSINHFKSNSLDEIFQWIDEKYPVVLKPIDSTGSDNVRICNNAMQVRQAFSKIMSSKNVMGKQNDIVLVQEYLQGNDIEYCVNTVSHQGKHFVSEIVKVFRRKIGNVPVHDYNQLLCPVKDHETYEILSPYVFSVLDALGIKNGPGHSELMLVNDRPILLETAARLPGIDLSAYSKALGFNQLTLWMESLINPEDFLGRISRSRRELQWQSSCVFFISPYTGLIKSDPDTKLIEGLPAFHGISLKTSGTLLATTDLINCPGYVFLLAKDKESLAEQRQQVREKEVELYKQMLQHPPTHPIAMSNDPLLEARDNPGYWYATSNNCC